MLPYIKIKFKCLNKHRTEKNMNVLKELSLIGIVPVIKIDRVEDALPLAKALCDGGLP